MGIARVSVSRNNGCCDDGYCAFRPERLRKILALIHTAEKLHVDPIELARSYLFPRGDQTMGRKSLSVENLEEDAICDVIAVQSALESGYALSSIEKIALYICPNAVSGDTIHEENESRRTNDGE